MADEAKELWKKFKEVEIEDAEQTMCITYI